MRWYTASSHTQAHCPCPVWMRVRGVRGQSGRLRPNACPYSVCVTSWSVRRGDVGAEWSLTGAPRRSPTGCGGIPWSLQPGAKKKHRRGGVFGGRLNCISQIGRLERASMVSPSDDASCYYFLTRWISARLSSVRGHSSKILGKLMNAFSPKKRTLRSPAFSKAYS